MDIFTIPHTDADEKYKDILSLLMTATTTMKTKTKNTKRTKTVIMMTDWWKRQVGVFVVYFLDYTLGSAWWVMVLYLIQVINHHDHDHLEDFDKNDDDDDLFCLQMFAVLMVRGKPYGSQQVASLLFPKKEMMIMWIMKIMMIMTNMACHPLNCGFVFSSLPVSVAELERKAGNTF